MNNMATPEPPIEVRAVSNALDFVESALGYLDERDTKIKFSILHLHVGIETLLKARLAFEDRRLVASKKQQSLTPAQFEAGEFASIRFDEALKMALERGLVLDERTRSALKTLSGERNNIVHFAPRSAESLRAKLVATLGVVWSALADPMFARRLDGPVRDRIADLHRDIAKRADFVAHVTESPTQGSVPLTCPVCRQRGAWLDSTIFTCKACAAVHNPGAERQFLATRYWLAFQTPLWKSNGTSLVGGAPCPVCREASTIVHLIADDRSPERELLCFKCGGGWTRDAFVDCEHCPNLLHRDLSAKDCLSCDLYPEESDRDFAQ
jgi:hypothetical protein